MVTMNSSSSVDRDIVICFLDDFFFFLATVSPSNNVLSPFAPSLSHFLVFFFFNLKSYHTPTHQQCRTFLTVALATGLCMCNINQAINENEDGYKKTSGWRKLWRKRGVDEQRRVGKNKENRIDIV